jgi:hypothetical protein
VSGWVPEGPAVIAILFFGWFYAGLTVGLARLTSRVFPKRNGDRNI